MKSLLSLFLSLLLIFSGIILAYFFLPKPYVVHYHANMEVYIDGKEWDFGGSQYMEEVTRCNVQAWVLPTDRVHLHENKWDLVHVHMAASTWGDLFSNLYWNFGSGYLVDDFGKIYLTGSGKNLYYILNGEVINNPHNRPVESEDRLLIWYGTGSEKDVLASVYPKVSSEAHLYNTKADPASCSANVEEWLWNALKEIFTHTHD